MVKINNPRQTVLVSCHGPAALVGVTEEKDDFFPLDWHSPASHEPRMYIILVSKKTPSLQRIRASGCFVVNFMPFDSVKNIIAAGKHFGEHGDKFVCCRLTRAGSEKLTDCPRIKEAIAWLECEVKNELDAGDHVLFIGKAIHSELISQEKRPFHVDGENYTTTIE